MVQSRGQCEKVGKARQTSLKTQQLLCLSSGNQQTAPCAVLVLARPVARAAGVPADPCWLSKKMSVCRAGKASKGFSRVMDAHTTSQMPGSGGGDKAKEHFQT